MVTTPASRSAWHPPPRHAPPCGPEHHSSLSPCNSASQRHPPWSFGTAIPSSSRASPSSRCRSPPLTKPYWDSHPLRVDQITEVLRKSKVLSSVYQVQASTAGGLVHEKMYFFRWRSIAGNNRVTKWFWGSPNPSAQGFGTHAGYGGGSVLSNVPKRTARARTPISMPWPAVINLQPALPSHHLGACVCGCDGSN